MKRILIAVAAVAALAVPALSAQVAFGQTAQDFTDWTSVGANVATGTLHGSTVTLSGTTVSPSPGSTLDGSSTFFNRADFTPPLATSDHIQFIGAGGNSYTLAFATPVTDPVLHLASIASTLHFAPGTVITRLSGDAQFSVAGSDVVGALDLPADDGNGTVRLSGTFTSIPFTTTFPGSDGIILQVGAPPPVPPATPPVPAPPPPPAIAPDFTLAFGDGADEFSTLTVAPGSESSLRVIAARNVTSNGTVQLAVSGLPPGVTATFTPPVLDGVSDTSTLTVRAAADASAFNDPITITATPVDAGAGPTARALNIDLLVQSELAARLEGIEITQAVQTKTQPRFQTYNGVVLVKRKKTVVRVFADLIGEPFRGANALKPDMGMALFGTDAAGRPLPGSPLFAEYAPSGQGMPINNPGFTESERNSSDGPFTFVLPEGWTLGSLNLRATPLAAANDTLVTADERRIGSVLCVRTACGSTGERVLNGMTFRDPPPAAAISALHQLVVFHAGGDPNGTVTSITSVSPPVDKVFEKLRALSPVPLHFLDNRDTASDWPRYRALRFASDNGIWEPADQFDMDIGRPGLGTVGVYNVGNVNGGVTIGHTSVVNGSTLPNSAALWRPVTSIAHEVFHLLGFKHAAPECGAGPTTGPNPDSVPWPVPQGRMDSVGIDTTPGSGQFGGPYRIIADTAASPAYDLMSYCGIGAGDPQHWISAHNWNVALGETPPEQRPIKALGRVKRTMVIQAITLPNPQFIRVGQTPLFTPQFAAPSGFTLVARNSAGNVIQTVPFGVITGTAAAADNPGAPLLEAQIPPAGVARVELVDPAGTVVATRAASAAAPVASIVAPRRGARLGTGATTTVRWKVSDADGDKTEVTLDFSDDGGRTFYNVWAGPGTESSARVPTDLLRSSRRARLRLRVSDGFNETVVTSARFEVVPRAPRVEILEPGGRPTVDAGGTLRLRGAAADDRGVAITGRRLEWRAAGRLLGRGTTINASLPAGARSVRLRATGPGGRTGTAGVAVKVRATTPFFVRVAAPSIARTARAAILTVSANQPATLSAGGRRYPVDTRVRRVRVPVGSGRTIRLKLTLSAGGKRSSNTITVRRR